MPLLPVELAEVAIEHHRRVKAAEPMTATHRVLARFVDSAQTFLLAVGWTRDIAEDYAHAHRRHLEEHGPAETGRPRLVAAMWREEWVPGKGWVEA